MNVYNWCGSLLARSDFVGVESEFYFISGNLTKIRRETNSISLMLIENNRRLYLRLFSLEIPNLILLLFARFNWTVEYFYKSLKIIREAF